MSYLIEIVPSYKRSIEKACKKNFTLRKVLKNKIREIVLFPSRYKHLKHDLAGEMRVHVLKSFVLKFRVDENIKDG